MFNNSQKFEICKMYRLVVIPIVYLEEWGDEKSIKHNLSRQALERKHDQIVLAQP